MKSLPIVVIAGCLFGVSWGTPLVWADTTKSAQVQSYSQSAADGSPIYSLGGSAGDSSGDGSEAAPTSQATGSTTKSPEHTGVYGLFWKWFKMGERIQADEPNWLSPLATTSGRLKQEFRYDVWRQPGTPGDTDYNFGGGKGLEFIAAPHVQLMVGAPPYIAHEGGKTPDG